MHECCASGSLDATSTQYVAFIQYATVYITSFIMHYRHPPAPKGVQTRHLLSDSPVQLILSRVPRCKEGSYATMLYRNIRTLSRVLLLNEGRVKCNHALQQHQDFIACTSLQGRKDKMLSCSAETSGSCTVYLVETKEISNATLLYKNIRTLFEL